MEVLGYFAVAMMGVVLGVLGGGGSILTVPILVYFFKINPIVATTYSLLVVGVTAVVGVTSNLRYNTVNYSAAIGFSLPSFVGIYISRSLLLPMMPKEIWQAGGLVLTKEIVIMGLFSVLTLAASFSMIRKKTPHLDSVQSHKRPGLSIAPKAFFVGLLTGLVGAGGGFLIVPTLIVFAGLHMRIAVGTSLLVIALNSLFGFTTSLSKIMDVQWTFLFTIIAIAVVGIVVGIKIGKRVPENKLKTAFGWFVLIVGSIVLIDQMLRL
jgi:uncharacterized membrane protein YfcA